MADSIAVSSLCYFTFGDKHYSINKTNDPGTATLTSDNYTLTRYEIADSTATSIGANGGVLNVYVPTVNGVFSWTTGAGTTSSVLGAQANKPLVLGRQSHGYDATLATRLASSETNVNAIYFYQATGSTAYIDVYSFS